MTLEIRSLLGHPRSVQARKGAAQDGSRSESVRVRELGFLKASPLYAGG